MNFRLGFLLRKWHVLGTPLFLAAVSAIAVVITRHPRAGQTDDGGMRRLDRTLISVLRNAGFTGKVEATQEAQLS